MSYTTWKFLRTPYNSATKAWDTASTSVLPNFYDPEVTVSMGNSRSTFKVKFTNVNGVYDNYFNPNDKLTISRVINSTSVASSDQIMIATAQDINVESDNTAAMVIVGGPNFSDVLLGTFSFGDLRTFTIPDAIGYLVSQINTVSNNLYTITWSPVSTTMSNGNAFPLVNEQWNYRTVKEFIEKYSTRQATTDGDYYYYIDSSNSLIWGKKTTVTSGTFDSSTSVYQKITTKKDLKGIRNWFIVKGGVDPDGSPIQIFYNVPSSIAKYGIKPYIITSISNNAETIVKRDKDKAQVTNMANASYPFVTTWDGVSYASYAAYVIALRAYIKAQCLIEGKAAGDAYADGTIQLDIDVRAGSLGWNVADLISCTLPSLGAVAKNLRVTQITYRTDSDTYSLQEDTGSI